MTGTTRKKLRWIYSGIDDILRSPERNRLNDDDVLMLNNAYELHTKAINGEISYEELDSEIEKIGFWGEVANKEVTLFLDGKPVAEGQQYRGLNKKCKLIYNKDKSEKKTPVGQWSSFCLPPRALSASGMLGYQDQESGVEVNQGEINQYSLETNSFYDLVKYLHGKFTKIIRGLGDYDITKHILIDHYRKVVVVLLPVSDTENHCLVFKFCERKWCTTMSKVKEHINSAANSANKIYYYEKKKISNLTCFFVGKNYSSRLQFSAIRHIFRRKVKSLLLGKRTPECFLYNNKWKDKVVKILCNFFEYRKSGVARSSRKMRVPPYGGVKEFIDRMKYYITTIDEFIGKERRWSSVLGLLRKEV